MYKKVIILIIFLLSINFVLAGYIDEYHYRTSLGNQEYNSILYSSPMAYPLQSGNNIIYQEINNSIIPSDRSGFSYEVEKGTYNSYFKEPANVSDLIMLENKNKITNATGQYVTIFNNETINITPVLMQYYNSTESELISNIQGVNGTITDNQINYSASYTDVNDSVDMVFKYYSDMIKEYLYLKDLDFSDTTLIGDVNLEFKNIIDVNLDVFDVYADPDGDNILTLQTGNFTNGVIEFRRKSDNLTIWRLPNAKSWDNSGEEINSHYRVIRGTNQLEIYTQTNWTWINDSSRTFPIVIDPTTSKAEGQAFITADAEIDDSSPDYNEGSVTPICIDSDNGGGGGGNRRLLFNFDFSSIGAGSISDASLNIYMQARNYGTVRGTGYYCDSSFTENTITWNNQDSQITNCDTSPFFNQSLTYFTLNQYNSVDLTSTIQQEINDDQIFTTKFIAEPEDSSSSYYVCFRSKEYSGSTYDPYLEITYEIGNNPEIPYVSAPASANPTENSNTVIYVIFNATDLDNYTDINTSSALVRLSKVGETNITSSSCSNSNDGNITVQFNCTISLPFYAIDGSWTVNAIVSDNQGATATNSSQSLNYGVLSAMTVDISAIGWGTITLNNNDLGANDTTILTNTGNQDFTNITVKGQALIGQVISSQFVNSTQFEAVTSNTANAGTSLQDNTEKQVTGATLPRGSSSTEELWYFGDFPLSLGITPQYYKTNTAWQLKVYT